MLSNDHKDILGDIVDLEGACLEADRCQRCPFAAVCLPEFVKDKELRPTKSKRYQMAADVLVRHELLGEEDDPSEQYDIQDGRHD